MRSPARRVLLALSVCSALSGCVAPRYGSRYGGPAASELHAGGAPRCRTGAGRSNPLVTEWPASEKANLEALLGGGAVAVEYSGCSMRVLTRCRLGGVYVWQRTTPSSDTVEIEDVDELYAKLPLGAVSLEGELKRSGKLSIATHVTGQLRLEGTGADGVPNAGECARATHIVGGLSVGSFTLDGSGKVGAKADVTVARLGSAGGTADRSAGIIRSAGDARACGQSTDAAPHPSCRSPIQVFLWPIAGRAAEEGPPGTVKVDLVSANASSRWDVYYDDQVICTTPCSRWLDPSHPLLLRTREEGRYYGGADKIRVLDLGDAASSGALQLQAHPTATGKMATGITFTAFGGMAVMTGIALTAIGCTASHTDPARGLCTGGLTTLMAGGMVTTGAIWLILDSLPHVELYPGSSSPGRSITVAFGPGFVAGKF